jgi:hypothetical protein
MPDVQNTTTSKEAETAPVTGNGLIACANRYNGRCRGSGWVTRQGDLCQNCYEEES